jgi:hypothetical protein
VTPVPARPSQHGQALVDYDSEDDAAEDDAAESMHWVADHLRHLRD